MNKEEKKKTRKRKVDNIEDSEPETKPRKKRAVAKPRKQQQETKQDDIPIIYYIKGVRKC